MTVNDVIERIRRNDECYEALSDVALRDDDILDGETIDNIRDALSEYTRILGDMEVKK